MTRPVTGYLTAQGKFFESLNEANLYEARYVLNKAAGMAVMELGVQGEENIREAIQNLVTFINENTDIIEGYISARRALAAEYPDNEVDGPPTTSDQTDDTQVRDEPDMEMEPPPETEASTETVGESTEQETVPF